MAMRILISGASIAGPVLAYWLTRYGFEVTVVERAPTLRKTGGHAVDLFRPAMEISAKMGVLPRIEDLATGTTRLTLYREGRPQPSRIDLTKIYAASSDRHVEIMRDDLSEVYYDAARDDVVVGADGLHSNVRRLTFGDEAGLTRFLGGYLSVVSAPKTLVGPGEMVGHVGVGRFAGIYTADHLDDARAVFLFRSAAELAYDHRDTARQKELLREAFAGMHDEVDGWLAETERTPTFYFDSITQLRTDRWSRRRVTLVGDAGYCPGPAVGGSTSLAVLGAYVLAGELARADGDHLRAFAAYELQMRESVRRSRSFARAAARGVIPGSRAGVWALTRGAQLVSAMPTSLARALAKLNTKGVRMHDSMPVPDYAGSDV
ncbi:FAD-dependent monooxygenase [Mycobacterium avium subsp. hominissuis]